MKYQLKTTLTALNIALGSTLAIAQAPTNDRAETTGSRPSDAPVDATAEVGRVAAVGTLEQLAITEPKEFEGKEIVNTSNEKIGMIDQVVRKTEDLAVYALITTDDDSTSAIKVSELEIGTLGYDGSASDIKDEVYLGGDYERVSKADAESDDSYSAAQTEGLGARGGLAGQANPARMTDQSFLEQLAMNAPDQLEGKSLVGKDGEDLGKVEQIVRTTTDSEMFAVVTVPDMDARSVVKLSDLKLSHLGYDGNADELRNEGFDSSDYQSMTMAE